ncbi:MAG: GreA/GreB family elongation factor [Crocinitomicaceae bacterium]|nr:GreA/GreB family elongation factor [Crocinitomicaceae bacterium]
MKKKILIDKATEVVSEKINELKSEILDLQDAMNTEGKSTVGDKHETNRAIIQNEIEQLGKQLNSHEQHLRVFSGIDFGHSHDYVESGSYVLTNKYNLFMGISLGKINVEGNDVQFVSMESPIAQALLKKKVGEEIDFHDEKIQILEIY